MKKIIVKFSASIRQALLARRTHKEIEHRIFPQLCGEKRCGYPFGECEQNLEDLATFGQFDTQLNLEMIERRAEQLPATYRQAFRYIMYRDLNTRMQMYLEFARSRTSCKAAPAAAQPQPAT